MIPSRRPTFAKIPVEWSQAVDLSALDFRILVAIFSHNPNPCPSLPRIADLVGVSISTVQRRLKELTGKYVAVTPRRYSKQNPGPNLYSMVLQSGLGSPMSTGLTSRPQPGLSGDETPGSTAETVAAATTPVADISTKLVEGGVRTEHDRDLPRDKSRDQREETMESPCPNEGDERSDDSTAETFGDLEPLVAVYLAGCAAKRKAAFKAPEERRDLRRTLERIGNRGAFECGLNKAVRKRSFSTGFVLTCSSDYVPEKPIANGVAFMNRQDAELGR